MIQFDLKILIFISGAFFLVIVRYYIGKNKKFDDLIKPMLKKNDLKLIDIKYPGLFKVGPFPRFEISFGKPQINNGAIHYEKSYYRIMSVTTKTKEIVNVWVKIETSWFKKTKIEFKPSLEIINP
tara:strand:+ start:114 stop:488 length:375 start_codon:yes stop_codon:yes gene_type:complete